MTREDHRRLTGRLLPAVVAAGRLELGYFRSGCAVDRKADRSPVTIADREAEAILLAALADIMPGIAVVSEEADAAGIRPLPTDPFVLVDPLDGTKQFVAGLPEFTVNVAVVAGGRPVYGLIYAPALADLLVTDGPDRAMRIRLDPASAEAERADIDALAWAPVTVRAPRQSGLIAVHSRSRNQEASAAFLDGFDVAERRLLGSSYKFCLVAAGEADIYPQVGRTSEWDTAAGEAVLVAAGGAVADMTGAPLAYGRRDAAYVNPPFVASCAPIDRLQRAAA